VITGIKNSEKEPNAIAGNMISRNGNPYPKGDPRYASTFEEDIADAQSLKQAELVKFHRQFYGAQNSFFSAVGDFDAAQVKAILETSFAGFKSEAPVARIPTPFVATKAIDLKAETPDKQNATLLASSNLELKELDPDHAALLVANQMFGGGTSSRLWNRIREKDGLSYGVGSYLSLSPWEASSNWSFYAIFAPQNLPKVRSAFDQELDLAISKGFTQKELDEAISSLIKTRTLSRAQDANVTGGWVNNMRLGTDFSRSAELDKRIAAVTVQQANGAFKKYIKASAIAFVAAGDFAKQ
jgi:zinc protease